MSKLFSSRKRLMGLGLMGTLVIALAVLGALWGLSQTASANDVGTVALVHVNPDGTNYTGNPYCPDTVWVAGKPTVNPAHDCNNITSQNHFICTVGFDTTAGMAIYPPGDPDGGWTLQNASGANAAIVSFGYVGTDAEYCVVIHSSTPGETRVVFTYTVDGLVYTTPPVMKEWDSLVDSVILKGGDEDSVKVYYDADGDTVVESSEYKSMWLPKDVNGDGVRDAADEHLLDKQSTFQDHGVVFDEALKRIKSPVPVHIIEVVHGEHDVLIDAQTITVHQPTEGALIEAVIVSERGCTFFTDAAGTVDLGSTLQGFSDSRGRFLVWVDTVCEEQAVITFYAQFPNLPGSLRLGVVEWVGINWTTVELAKQPQIRWAGEEIVLAKRWALPAEYYPNTMTVDTTVVDQPVCPLATIGGAAYSDADEDEVEDTVVTHQVNYVLKDPGLGALEGAYIDIDGDGVLDSLSFGGQSEAVGHIDDECISKALADSEEPGQQDIEAKLMEVTYFCPWTVIDQLPAPTEVVYDGGKWVCALPDGGPVQFDADKTSEVLVNKHAFLVWYLKVYQVKLTNVPGTWSNHNAGTFSAAEGVDLADPSVGDTEEETLNVSTNALQRVVVKGWFFGGNKSGRGAVCIDIDGDGNGLEGEEASEAGVPYQLPLYEEGCPDSDDEIVDHGHWVLPDDLPALAGPNPMLTRPNWDVMSDIGDSPKYAGAIGPKSTLDSHDAVLRAWVGRKTVDPDGEITAADAIMPPLKIRASIAAGDAGFVPGSFIKGAGLGLYGSIMIPADPEIPAMVNNGGYDWDSWGLPPCPDADSDGVCDDVDLCPAVFDPTNADTDNDDVGDACDDDTDGDTILDDGDESGVVGDAPCANLVTTNCDDNCRLKSNATQADADGDGIGDACDNADDDADGAAQLDSDGDTVVDGVDNCPAKSNATQLDTDGDAYGDACDHNPALAWWAVPPVAYPFWTIINKSTEAPGYPRYIEFYTDNRGWGFFPVNGDYNLSFDDCRTDPVSGAFDCNPGDKVGESNITVIGDYPYFRKHAAVQSNPVTKTWEWGGFKAVTAERIDATHTAVIAHLKDRDGFCKYKVKSDPTAKDGVQFSPSLNPVQGEEIEFILNTEVGSIIEASPNGLYSAAHVALGKARVLSLADGVIINRSEAVALAEDERVLGAFGEARPVREDDECQAWVIIEHPLGEEPDVSVRFHDPEGVILRHWPPSELLVNLVQGWNDSCYVGPDDSIEDAMADVIDDVLAVYRFNPDQTWERYFPGRCDEEGLCTMETLESYNQLFILMGASAPWAQLIEAPPVSVDLVGASAEDEVAGAWNSVCYAGTDKAAEEATSDISSAFVIMYTLGSDQAWRRYVPGRPEIPDTLTTLHQFDSVVLLVTAEGGITWVFDP